MCNICCSPYTSKLRKQVTCNFCKHECCTQCVKNYLLSIVTDPKCMKCDTAWNKEFIDAILSRHFRVNDLKKHRQDVLLNREKSLLPGTICLAEIELHKRKAKKEIDDLLKTRDDLFEQIENINVQMHTIRVSMNSLKPPKEHYKNVFIKVCPSGDCRGFLDSKFKCSLCDTKVCKDCHEIMAGDDHECVPENIETAKLISSQCKPCPQCASLIYKLSGCNQIWCTQCKTAFDWTTGKIENTNIHNPHYYEWMRTQNAAVAGEAGECDGAEIPSTWRIQEYLRKHKLSDYDHYNYLRAYNHIRMIEIPRYRVIEDNTDLRVDYILKEISEDELKTELYKREAKNNKMEAFRLLHQMLLDAMGDLIRKILTVKTYNQCDELDDEFNELRSYFNKNMIKIGERFNMKSVRELDNLWYMI